MQVKFLVFTGLTSDKEHPICAGVSVSTSPTSRLPLDFLSESKMKVSTLSFLPVDCPADFIVRHLMFSPDLPEYVESEVLVLTTGKLSRSDYDF